MRKVIILALAIAGLALLAGVAMADNGPHGGPTGFGADPDGCAACHRVHTGDAANLLNVAGTMTAFCTTCHDYSGNTDVVDGVWQPTMDGLKGGGFTLAKMDTNADGTVDATSTAITSKHNVDESGLVAWGGGPADSTTDTGTASFSLDCTSCHNPHGNGNYRILRNTPEGGEGGNVTSGVNLSDATSTAEIVYTISYVTSSLVGGSTGYYRDVRYADNRSKNISGWCAECHSRHEAGTGSGSTALQDVVPADDPVFTYRHTTSVGSLAGQCMACHVAHGTNATMSTGAGTYSGAVDDPTGSPSSSSRLLHVNDRGVCARCHLQSGGTGLTDITAD